MHPFGRPDDNQYIYSPKKAEISLTSTLIHPRDKTVLATVEQYHEPEVNILNDTVKADFEYLQRTMTDGIPIVADASEGEYDRCNKLPRSFCYYDFYTFTLCVTLTAFESFSDASFSFSIAKFGSLECILYFL